MKLAEKLLSLGEAKGWKESEASGLVTGNAKEYVKKIGDLTLRAVKLNGEENFQSGTIRKGDKIIIQHSRMRKIKSHRPELKPAYLPDLKTIEEGEKYFNKLLKQKDVLKVIKEL
jgi:hypothetical protein